jgi:lipid-binding SYLF domain-containing protein
MPLATFAALVTGATGIFAGITLTGTSIVTPRNESWKSYTLLISQALLSCENAETLRCEISRASPFSAT